ncbi:MAG: hypothetical protein Q9201_000885 [Fulgogasparrea decipioides]
MAPLKSVGWTLALPCLLVATVSLLKFHPSQFRDAAGVLSELVPRRLLIGANVTNIRLADSPSSVSVVSPQQNPESSPPIPIFQFSEIYINAAINDTSSPSLANTTLPFANGSIGNRGLKHSHFHRGTSTTTLHPLVKRAAEPCSRSEPCPDKSQIDADGLTHLYFAFAKIDPGNFAVVPDQAADIPLYTAFTARKTSTLQTWIAIGGFDFSDPGPTRNTWSDLVSTEGNRAAFINSVKNFMSQYGFQGVDLDWEYPATPERGGKRADTDNFVSLVKEMKAAFGGQYGLSVTLAPDYWYLRGFDCKAMEPHVDMFGFMAYDLHGFWDADLKTLGAIVRGQTDVREIYNDIFPLWFDNLDPAKINFGLAYYGRGYTLAKPGCNQLKCPFIGPSSPGPCSHYGGVLSLAEIKDYIKDKGLQPQLIEEAMMKQITWDDQWIGYDDEETVAMKKRWASGHCFGGTMIWSIDFKSGSGSNSNNKDDNAPVTTDGLCGKDHGNTICGDWPDGGL